MAHFTGTSLTRMSLACAAAAMCSSVARADALHGFCSDCSGSSEMGTSASGPLADFGFWDAGKNNTGTYFVDILIPDNGGSSAPSANYAISGGASGRADLVRSTAWTSGKLDSYLGIHASPSNPLSAWLHATRSLDPKAMGYWIFQANLGMNELGTSSGTGPLLKLNSTLPAGSVVVAFLETSSGHGASASDESRPGHGNGQGAQGMGENGGSDHGKGNDNNQGNENDQGDDNDQGHGDDHGHGQANNGSYTATANGSALFETASGDSTGQSGGGGATIPGHGVPEPGTMALLLTALLGFGMTLLPRRAVARLRLPEAVGPVPPLR